MAPVLLHDLLDRAAERDGDRPALHAGERAWSSRELARASSGLAALLAERGVTAGRVAVMSSGRPEMVVAVHALSRLGVAAVLLSPAWRAAEVRAALELTAPVLALADGPAVALLGELLGPDRVLDLDDPAVTEARGAAGPALPGPQPSDDAVLVFSSGTTGLPKAVRHTHRSLLHATEHWRAALGLGPQDRFQVATPPSHVLGLLNLLAATAAGASVRLHRRFDLDEVLRRVDAERMTLEMAVAPVALAMAAHPRLEDYDLSSLRYLVWAATPVTPSVADTVTRRTGVRWLTAYGASEVPVLAANPVDRPQAWRLDSVGLAPPGVELRVVDLDTGEVLPPGASGEVQARSASAMAGYLPAEATGAAFADGWYRTGDVGRLDPDGWLQLTDRAKELVKVNGFQVAPAELEAVLLGHPAVRDCAVFGVPDPRTGEAPVAAVVLAEGAAATPEELAALVADSLATYKRLRAVVLVDEVPRLPSGKVLRRVLRDRWVEQAAPPGR